jgi:hypothetical protein
MVLLAEYALYAKHISCIGTVQISACKMDAAIYISFLSSYRPTSEYHRTPHPYLFLFLYVQ